MWKSEESCVFGECFIGVPCGWSTGFVAILCSTFTCRVVYIRVPYIGLVLECVDEQALVSLKLKKSIAAE